MSLRGPAGGLAPRAHRLDPPGVQTDGSFSLLLGPGGFDCGATARYLGILVIAFAVDAVCMVAYPLQPLRERRRGHRWGLTGCFLAMSLQSRLRRRVGAEGSGSGFGFRLVASFAVTLACVGAAAYFLLSRELSDSIIGEQAASQRADAAGFQEVSARTSTSSATIREIGELLDAIARRPGTLETLLIDTQHVIRASGNDRLVGTTESDPRVVAALSRGTEYAGKEADPRGDRANFEFVVPVYLPSGRYAYEVSYSHQAFDSQLNGIRRVLIIVGLLLLIGGSGIFYLVGGRSLMRSHRFALRRATRDGLTDLPNQRAFQDEFPATMATAVRHNDSVALAFLDIDDFKFINDRYGYPYGDALLAKVAGVLRDSRSGDRAYRIGGDEFAALFAHTDTAGVRVLAQRLQRNLRQAGIKASVGASALRPGQPADALRAEAHAALYEAKRQGGDEVAHFDDIRAETSVVGTTKRAAVRRLIDEGNLTTAFQPIWNLSTGTLLGIEALTRPDPSYGLAGPGEAFDIAEQIGHVHQLDVLSVTNALATAPPLPPKALLFVNLCPQTLDLDADHNDWLRHVVEHANLSPSRIVVEVTERFGARTASIIKCLEQLRTQGFKIALDDVGTGNSGLEMLRNVKAEYVKIDGGIVTAAATDPNARAVLLAMATYARQTGSFVIAEGIGDEETLAFLHAIDTSPATMFQGGQGYSLGRPSQTIEATMPGFLSDEQAAA